MVKIKQKKKMTLPELIQWAWDNPEKVKGKIFRSERMGEFEKYREVLISDDGHAFRTNLVTDKDTFTVEVEEEITQETELPKYLEIYAHKSLGYGDENISIGKNQSIKEILKENKKYSTITKAIHLINDDGTHTLIWKDGELVGDE